MRLIIYAVLTIIALTFLTSVHAQNAIVKSKADLQIEIENVKTFNLPDEDLIREIVFRKFLELRHSNSDKNSKVYYLQIDDNKDPSKNLLKKFADYRVTIKKASELIISVGDSDPVSDSLAKEKGVLFSISKLDWKSKNEVKVNAISYSGNLGSDGCSYTLKRVNGEWKIVSVEDCFVS